MTYLKLYSIAVHNLETNQITLGEYEEMIKPLNREIEQWIPVSERVPDDMCHVWLTCISNVDDREPWVCDGFYNPYYHGTKYSRWGNIPMLNWGEAEVIAWMEQDIPTPYSAQEGEQTDG